MPCTDGFTSLAVVVGAADVALGVPAADPVVGLLITVAILFVLRDAAREVYRRLMDAVEPELLTKAERSVAATPGVEKVNEVRMRWIGHALRAEVDVAVDGALPLDEGHRIADDIEHRLLHDVPRLSAAIVHVSPRSTAGHASHEIAAHHPLNRRWTSRQIPTTLGRPRTAQGDPSWSASVTIEERPRSPPNPSRTDSASPGAGLARVPVHNRLQ